MGGMLEFLQEHFWHAGPILASGLFAIVIVLDRVRVLYAVYPMREKKQFFERIRGFIMADRLVDAIGLCAMMNEKPIVQVVREGLIRAHQPEEMAADGLAMAVTEVTEKIQKRTAFLATIANVATLLGLFGTIAGLISSFEAVGKADPGQKSAMLAAGISTAMNATMLGLGVAIPCMVLFSILMSRTNALTTEVSQAAIQVMDMLRQRFYGNKTSGQNQNQTHNHNQPQAIPIKANHAR